MIEKPWVNTVFTDKNNCNIPSWKKNLFVYAHLSYCLPSMTNILDEFTCNHCFAPNDEVQRANNGRWNSQFFNILLFIFGTLWWESVIVALRSPSLHCLCKWFCLWLTAHSNGVSGRIITACLQHSCYLGKLSWWCQRASQVHSWNTANLSKYPQLD